jgi:hypothetical protein
VPFLETEGEIMRCIVQLRQKIQLGLTMFCVGVIGTFDVFADEQVTTQEKSIPQVPLILQFRQVTDEQLPKHGKSISQMPFVVQLEQAADILVVGWVEKISETRGMHHVTTFEVQRVIAAVWERNEMDKHFDLSGITKKKIVIVQKLPFSDQDAAFLRHGRNLCWLKHVSLSEAEQKDVGYPSAVCYTPVKGRTGHYGMTVSGVVCLTPYKEMVDEEEYARTYKILGKDLDWYEERNRQTNFEVKTADAVLETAVRLSGWMVQGKDTAEELRLLSQSDDKRWSKIASCLLELGGEAQRFKSIGPMTK